MPSSKLPFSAVLRLPDVVCTKAELERALGLPVDRFEATRDGLRRHAQINVAEGGDIWASLMAFVRQIGPAIIDLLRREELSKPFADIAVEMADDSLTTSLLIPSDVAGELARWGFDIEVSVYLTAQQSLVT